MRALDIANVLKDEFGGKVNKQNDLLKKVSEKFECTQMTVTRAIKRAVEIKVIVESKGKGKCKKYKLSSVLMTKSTPIQIREGNLIETQNNHSYVYLLLSTDGEKFKIGKADNVYSRYATLKKYWGGFNLKKSMQIKCDKKQVHNLEKILHFVFDNYNINLPSDFDGYTEWFDSNCFEDAVDLLKDIAWKIPDNRIQIIEGIKQHYKKRENKVKEQKQNTLTKEEEEKEERERHLQYTQQLRLRDEVAQKLMDHAHKSNKQAWELNEEEYTECWQIRKMGNYELENHPLLNKWMYKYVYGKEIKIV